MMNFGGILSMRTLAIFLACVIVHQYSCVSAYDHEKSLHDLLLENYSYHIRPMDTGGDRKATEVAFSVRLLQIFELEEKSQILASSIFVLQKWTDHRLSWNYTKYGNVKTLLFKPSLIWTPDIVIMNNAVGTYSGKDVGMSAPVHVSYNGEVVWYSTIIIKTFCKMKVLYFPFDEQFCPMKFSSWSHNETEIILKSAEDTSRVTMNYTENSAWELGNIELRIQTTSLAFLNPRIPKTLLNYIVHMKRKAFYYFVYIFAPCLLASILMMMIFLLPPECGERMVVGITSMLALTVFFLLAAKNIPETSEDVPIMGRYYSVTLVEMTIALFCTAVVLRMHHSSSKMPKFVKVYILRLLARLVRIKTPHNTKVLLRDEKGGDAKQQTHSTPFDGEDSGLVLMAEQLIEDAESDAVQDEWKLAAKVLNRFFLWLYTLSVVLGVVGIFLQTPGLIVARPTIPNSAL